VRRLLLTGAVAAVTLVFAFRSAGSTGNASATAERVGTVPGFVAFAFAPAVDGPAAAPDHATQPAPVNGAVPAPAAQLYCEFDPPPAPGHAFYFTRGVYSNYRGWGRRGRGSWSVDWPKSDCQFNVVLRRLTNINSFLEPNAVPLDDPALLRFPYLYILEVGSIALSPGEISNLRDYLLKGGFLFVDDFWGSNEWYPFEDAMRQVLPEYPIEPLPLEHEYFRAFYQVDSIVQVPNQGNAQWGQTSECPGCYPEVYGIFDDRRRLMVVINWNTDIGDAWEWAEQPYYPVKYSTYAFEVGVNAIIYAMSH
jgi:hypothetical protein